MKSKFGNLQQPESLPSKERQNYVTKLFDDLAPNYDRFNRWVSLFQDDLWRRKTIEMLSTQASGTILDLAAGTGDLAHSASQYGSQEIHVFDISYPMLDLAKTKLFSNGRNSVFAFEQGSANLLPFKNESFNGIVSGFAMRNVFHFLDEVLGEMMRVLKPNGRFAILELSQPRNWILRQGFRIHLKTIMPLIGKLAAGQSTPFSYLRETTMTFLSPLEFRDRLEKAGFTNVNWQTFLLGGIAIHFGQKS